MWKAVAPVGPLSCGTQDTGTRDAVRGNGDHVGQFATAGLTAAAPTAAAVRAAGLQALRRTGALRRGRCANGRVDGPGQACTP